MVPIRNLGRMRCRRAFDTLLACAAIGLFLPLLTAVAVVLKIASRGPVLRGRVRVCRDGSWVRALEFRMSAVPGRAARCVHRFLRRTRIDTLPQLVNVLRGELSLVGADRPAFLA